MFTHIVALSVKFVNKEKSSDIEKQVVKSDTYRDRTTQESSLIFWSPCSHESNLFYFHYKYRKKKCLEIFTYDINDAQMRRPEENYIVNTELNFKCSIAKILNLVELL